MTATTPITETATRSEITGEVLPASDLLSIAEIRDYVTSAPEPAAAIRAAVMIHIEDGLYSALTETSGHLHHVGLVGLSEDILRGREEPAAFLAVLDAHEAGR